MPTFDTPLLCRRRSGILLHVTSLPSPFGTGDLGPEAYRFVDTLVAAKQSIWQVLPLNPVDPGRAYSPYATSASFAGNPLLISPEQLVRKRYLPESALAGVSSLSGGRAQFGQARALRETLLREAFERFMGDGGNAVRREAFKRFREENRVWLDDFVLYRAIKSEIDARAWQQWPPELRRRDPDALREVRENHARVCTMAAFVEFLFHEQWCSLRRYANERGVSIMGDIPIYVAFDSVDTWANTEFFKLAADGGPAALAGVPPDYFSAKGQLWHNPVYRWDALKRARFDWWIRRLQHAARLYDAVRIDHFRGLIAFWEVPAGENTAVNGHWRRVPHQDFFREIRSRCPGLSVIAEDLGDITPDVRQAMSRFGFPGMRVLMFGFDRDDPTYVNLPHNYPPGSVAYTGTHDTNTLRGWLRKDARPQELERLFRYLGRKPQGASLQWDCIRLIMLSSANASIFPLQDVLGLGTTARMNRPGTAQGNWRWRLEAGQFDAETVETLGKLTFVYGRGSESGGPGVP